MSQYESLKKYENKPYPPLAEFARYAAAHGCVLLENQDNVLPISKSEVISLFGRTQINYYKSGTGSGGLVNTQYSINILDGILNCPHLRLNTELVEIYRAWIKENPFDYGPGWAQEPWCQFEMVPDEKTVVSARQKSDIAVIVIGRTAGEDKDNSASKGSWYLTDEEDSLLNIVSKHFEKTVVLLNTGNIIDMKWVKKYNIKSVMYIWQGGQEGGNAVADVLCGNVNPSGKLTDTIAKDIFDYPSVKNFGNDDYNIYAEDIYVGYRYFETFAKDDVLYPFGYGLSYTDFSESVEDISDDDKSIKICVSVKNIGNMAGQQTLQVYYEPPQGLLGKPSRILSSFKKTGVISPGDEEIVHLEFPINSMASYDDSGITGNKSCYVLEGGEYNIYLGDSVRSAKKIHTHTISQITVVKHCTEVLAPEKSFDIMYPKFEDGKYHISYKPVSTKTSDIQKLIKNNLPNEITQTGNKGIKLADVKSKKNTMDEFVAQLSNEDLFCLARGEGMCSPKVRAGSAGTFGGVTESLSKFGIPIVSLHDGPSGIRIDSGEYATSLPSGTAIACTWDPSIAYELYKGLSAELFTHNIDSILGPGMNIHRVPLNGRNFEYFSEDPYLTGLLASEIINGVNVYGNSATIKHFFANSQEHNRKDVDSVMSERAAREIYLKCFEIAVSNSNTKSIMTSYNPVNGTWTANSYELNTIVLRNEWGYKGMVVTDWWPKLSKEKDECKNLKNMVEAQNDVYMPTSDALNFNDNLEVSLKSGEITLGQLQRNAKNILNYIMNSHSLDRFLNFGGKNEKSLFDSINCLSINDFKDFPKPDNEYQISLSSQGRCLVRVIYSSDEPATAQIPINIKIESKSAASVTVNGTEGNENILYRDISVISKKFNFSINYPESIINIKKVEFLK